MALGRFVLLPEDDLTLASVLKSPLVARDDDAPVDDDDLFRLAHDRGNRTLWQRLRYAVGDGAPYKNALRMLTEWRARAGFMSPYEFFSNKRKALLRRLGTEAADPIDAFLAEVLNFQVRNTPSLRDFLGWLEGADLQIKRDMDHGANEVRVMTVHGAKGLESNIVVLPDTTDVPDGRNTPSILFDQDTTIGSLPVWRLRSEDQVSATRRLKDHHERRAFEEYYRLLYVAMTRACDRLYVCGYSNKDVAKPGSWYALISDVMAHPEYLVGDSGDTPGVWRTEGEQTSPPKDEPEDAGLVAQPIVPPPWAMSAPAPEPSGRRWYVPSKLSTGAGDADTTPEKFEPPLSEPASDRFRRGNIIHKLLQILPDVPTGEREAIGQRYLSQAGLGLDEQEAVGILEEVTHVLNDPKFAAVFAPGSRAEVPLAAKLDVDGRSMGITGQIDRLAVTDDAVMIVDYKTNRPAPTSLDKVDPTYIRQLAAYRSALTQLYPDRNIRAALLWTNTAQLMEVPGAMLEAALS